MKNTNKYLLLTLSLFCASFLNGCSLDNTLLVLNWGEYINDEVVAQFEQEYGVNVKISTADSNELFYSKVKSKTTAYDLVIPSDYMVEKMYESNLLQEIDKSKLSNFNQDNFLPGVKGIEGEMFEEYTNYQVPYFWGTFGIMYNKRKSGLEECVKENGIKTLFERDILPNNTKVGMYNVPRFAYSCALSYLNEDFNVQDEEHLNAAKKVLMGMDFYEWGTDQLKKDIQNGVLDLAFVYTGDFLDMLYEDFDNDIERTGTCKEIDEYNYGLYIPDNTIAFMDSFVMLKNARHTDIAYQFIDYFLKCDNAYANASVVGYCTPLVDSYNKIIQGINDVDIFNKRWGEAVSKYYPLPDETWGKSFQGTPLKNFSQEFLTKIINMVNAVKAS